LDARECPSGRFGEDLIRRSREPLQRIADSMVIRHARPQAGIPERDAGIADQTTPFGAFDGASAKERAKVIFRKSKEPFQPWKEE